MIIYLVKTAGAHVIALCGSTQKAAMLQGLGAERVINYKTDDPNAILKKEYPKVSTSLSSSINIVVQPVKVADAHIIRLPCTAWSIQDIHTHLLQDQPHEKHLQEKLPQAQHLWWLRASSWSRQNGCHICKPADHA